MTRLKLTKPWHRPKLDTSPKSFLGEMRRYLKGREPTAENVAEALRKFDAGGLYDFTPYDENAKALLVAPGVREALTRRTE